MTASLTLAQHFRARREPIMQSWVTAVLLSTELDSAANIDSTQLRDHVPSLLEDLALRFDRRDHRAESTDADAGAHGYFRWQQGYSLSEVLHELSLLRKILIQEIFEHARTNRDTSPENQLSNTALVNSFIDEVVSISTVRFAEQQQAELLALSHSRLGLLRTVSHEVRNAVNAIHLVLEFHRDSDEATEREQSTTTLRRTVSHLRDLLDNLLDFAQLSAGEMIAKRALVDPVALARELDETYRQACEEAGLRFHVEVDPTLEKVESDPLKLRQISSNLLSNALKYTQQGEIRLKLGSVDATHWSLELADTGRGMAPETLTRLFEEFYRAPGTESIHGSGLGLAITKRLVEMLGGTISVESKLDEGSTFFALLPKNLGTAERPQID